MDNERRKLAQSAAHETHRELADLPEETRLKFAVDAALNQVRDSNPWASAVMLIATLTFVAFIVWLIVR